MSAEANDNDNEIQTLADADANVNANVEIQAAKMDAPSESPDEPEAETTVKIDTGGAAVTVPATSAIVPGWCWDDLQCPICLDPLMDALVASCSHRFCTFCIHRWFRTRGQSVCPVCRSAVSSIVGSPDLDAAIARLAPGHLNEAQIREREVVRRVRWLDTQFVEQEQRLRLRAAVTVTSRSRAHARRHAGQPIRSHVDHDMAGNGGWWARGERPASRLYRQPPSSEVSLSSAASTRPNTATATTTSLSFPVPLARATNAAASAPAPEVPASASSSSSSTPRLRQIEEIERIAEEFETYLRRAQRANERRLATERELNSHMGQISWLYERFSALGVLTSRDEVDEIRPATPTPAAAATATMGGNEIRSFELNRSPAGADLADARDDSDPILLMYRELDDVFGEAIFTAGQFQEQQEPESESDDQTQAVLNFLQGHPQSQQQQEPYLNFENFENFDDFDFAAEAHQNLHSWPEPPTRTATYPALPSSPYDPAPLQTMYTSLGTGQVFGSIYNNNFSHRQTNSQPQAEPQRQLEYEFDAASGVWNFNSYQGTDTETYAYATSEEESTPTPMLTPRPRPNYANRSPFTFNSGGMGSGTQGSPSPKSRQLIAEAERWREFREDTSHLQEIIRERGEATEQFLTESGPEVSNLTEQRERELGLPPLRRRERRRALALPNGNDDHDHTYSSRPSGQLGNGNGGTGNDSGNFLTLRAFLEQLDANSRPGTATTETETEVNSDQERELGRTEYIQHDLHHFFRAGENELNFPRLITDGHEQGEDDGELFEYHEFGPTPEPEDGEGEDRNGNRSPEHDENREDEHGLDLDRFFDQSKEPERGRSGPLFRRTCGSYHFHHHTNGYGCFNFTREGETRSSSSNSTPRPCPSPPPSSASAAAARQHRQFAFEFEDGSRIPFPYQHAPRFAAADTEGQRSQGETPGASRVTTAIATAVSGNYHEHDSNDDGDGAGAFNVYSRS